tara:strand:+ start:2905 stop:3384 length:480 start_codon:yes stop_codon:yes gene_type:complete
MNTINDIFSFPNPANEIAARFVAGMVLILTTVIILTENQILAGFLVYGFLARVATGPTLSPMGLLATRVIVPALGNLEKPVAGPPKRFAQTVGLVFSTTAFVMLWLDLVLAFQITLTILAVFAALESIAGFCAGCFVFSYLMKWGLIPESVCESCMIQV